MATVRPGEGVYQDSKSGKILVRRGAKFEEVKDSIKVVRRGSGGGGSGAPSFETFAQKRAREEAVRKAEAARLAQEKARQAEVTRKQFESQQMQERQKILFEKQRIFALKQKLLREGSQKQIRNLVDKNTRERIKQETIINRRTGERIFTTTNLRTGKVTTRTFQKPKGGGLIRETGGLITPARVTTKKLPAKLFTIPNVKLQLEKKKVKSFLEKIFKTPLFIKTSQEEIERVEKETRKYARDSGVKVLIKEGKLPDAVMRAAEIIIGEPAIKIGSFLRRKAIGGRKLTDEEIQKAGASIAEFGLFIGLNPFLKPSGELVSSLPKDTIVKFGGKQSKKGGTIVTEVFFESNGKIIGTAKGVSVPEGEKAVTLTIGKSIKGRLFSAKGKKDLAKSMKKLKTKKGTPFSAIEKSIGKDQVEQVALLFQVPRKTITQLMKKNRAFERFVFERKRLTKQIQKLIRKLKDNKFSSRKGKISKSLQFRKNSLRLRLNKIQNKIKSIDSKIKKEISQGKIPKQTEKIVRGVKFRKSALKVRKDKLSKQISKITQQLKKFKGVTRGKKVKASLKFRKNSLMLRKQKLQGQLNSIIKSSKVTKTKTKIKSTIQFEKGATIVRKQKIRRQLKSIINELKKNKFSSRRGKISNELQFRKNSLMLRKQKLQGQLKSFAETSKVVKRFKKVFPKRIKLIITKNLKKVTQISQGKIKVGKGKRDIEEFGSIADIFTSNDLSKIVGETITKKGDRIKFIGFIKNIAEEQAGFTLSQVQKTVYKDALEQVMKVVGNPAKIKQLKLSTKSASAIAQTLKTIPSKSVSLRSTSSTTTPSKPTPRGSTQITTRTVSRPTILRKSKIKTKQLTTSKSRQTLSEMLGGGGLIGGKVGTLNTGMTAMNRLSEGNIPNIKIGGRFDIQVISQARKINKINQKIKQLQKQRIKLKQRSRIDQKIKQLQKQKQKQKQELKQKLKQKQKQLQKQKQKLKQKQKQKLKQKLKSKLKVPIITPRVPKKPKIPIIIPRIPKGFKKKTIRKSQPVYFVREKVRGKIKNLTPRPLTLRDAKDFLAYRLDNRLSRTGYFEPLGKTRNVVNVPSKMKGYFARNSRKLRPYKIRVGKKKELRRGYIEKRTYAFDRPGERVKTRTIKRTSNKRTISKRKTTKKKRK